MERPTQSISQSEGACGDCSAVSRPWDNLDGHQTSAPDGEAGRQ